MVEKVRLAPKKIKPHFAIAVNIGGHAVINWTTDDADYYDLDGALETEDQGRVAYLLRIAREIMVYENTEPDFGKGVL